MTRHLTDSEIQQYHLGVSAPDDLIAANDHLAHCADCYRRFNPKPDISRLYASMRATLAVDETPLSEHLNYEELAGVVDGRLNGDTADRCVLHIEDCEECREDVEWLRGFKGEDLAQSRKAATVAGEGGIKQADASEKSPHNTAADVLRPYREAGAYRLAALAVSILLIAGAAVWLFTSGLRRENASLRGQVDRLMSDGDALRRATSELESLRGQLAELKGQAGRDNGSARELGPPAIIELKDSNGSVQLYKDGGLRGIESAPASYQELVGKALALGEIRVKPIHTTRVGKQDALLGEGDRGRIFKVLEPASTAVESARPEFSWTEEPGASSYTVFVKDLRSGSEMSSGPLSSTRWTPGSDLVRGRGYAWMVEANEGGKLLRAPRPSKPFAQFRVIAASELDEVRKARATCGNSHLVMAVVYAKNGLRSESERELKQLAEANPDSSAAEKLYRRVKRR
jgi:hypothetical protein